MQNVFILIAAMATVSGPDDNIQFTLFRVITLHK